MSQPETTPETNYEMTGNFLKGYWWKRTAPDGTIIEGHAKTFEAANAALFGEGKDGWFRYVECRRDSRADMPHTSEGAEAELRRGRHLV